MSKVIGPKTVRGSTGTMITLLNSYPVTRTLLYDPWILFNAEHDTVLSFSLGPLDFKILTIEIRGRSQHHRVSLRSMFELPLISIVQILKT